MNTTNIKPAAIAVVGFGKTGKGVLDFFLESQHDTQPKPNLYLYNDTPIGDTDADRIRYAQQGVTFLIGEETFGRLTAMDRVIISPGVDGRTPRFDLLREKGIPILSEIELACALIQAPIIGVTGSNGKSTTVSLTHHLLSQNRVKSYLAGNIGAPLIAEVNAIAGQPGARVVLELSSFQLEEIVHFKPHIAMILNITPDHMDRYPGMADYIAAKLNIVNNQDAGDVLILNQDDAVLREIAQTEPQRLGAAQRIWFSVNGSGPGVDLWIDGQTLHSRLPGIPGVETLSLAHNPLRGMHNLENIMASVAAVRLSGVPISGIETHLSTFKGLAHRMESAGRIGNIEFINDSKATNIDAALKSIGSIPGPMIVILGGKDKGGDFRMLSALIRERVHTVFLVGKAAGVIRSQLEQDGLKDKLVNITDFTDGVEQGVRILSQTGGVVLLAPGCASFDMFNNFEHRGDVFKQAVADYRNHA